MFMKDLNFHAILVTSSSLPEEILQLILKDIITKTKIQIFIVTLVINFMLHLPVFNSMLKVFMKEQNIGKKFAFGPSINDIIHLGGRGHLPKGEVNP